MLEALVVLHVERHRHAEDGLTVLDTGDPARHERPSVPDAVDQEHGLFVGVPGPQKVSVQRMHVVGLVHGMRRRGQGLGCHLTTEGPDQAAREGRTAVDVLLDRFETQDLLNCCHTTSVFGVVDSADRDRRSPADTPAAGDRRSADHRSSSATSPSWTARATSAALVGAARPMSEYLARIRVRCVLTVPSEM